MDPGEIDALVQRLVANPYDAEALQYAHREGAADPKSYAYLLERVGSETSDPQAASHWLSEAANVWSVTLGDAHRAARILMMAVDRDPTQQLAAERLAQLYRDKGDVRALVALLDRRARALSPLASTSEEIRGELAGMYEELGRLWSEAPLVQPKKAVEAYRRAIEIDPQSAYAMYNARELLKALGEWDEALAMYAMELAIETDPARRLALLRDEAAARKVAGDLPGVTRALADARRIDDRDPALKQEYASSVLERMLAGERVGDEERAYAAAQLVSLAETYEGEHGFAYASGASDIWPADDRAIQLYAHYARQLQREGELSNRHLAYLEANPHGTYAREARHSLSASYAQAAQYRRAIDILEPLADEGDADALAKLEQLYPLAESAHEAPPPSRAARPSVPPARPSRPPPPPASVRPPPPLPSARPSAPPPAPRVSLPPPSLPAPPVIHSAPPEITASSLLADAHELVTKNDNAGALAKYNEVLAIDAAHPEALAWVEDHLRSTRSYAQLRDVILASVRSQGSLVEGLEARKERLREVAGICESNLRDDAGAVGAYKLILALDRTDESARTALTRLLEKTQRWDDLANLLEQMATAERDVETKVVLEKKIAALHEQKRNDLRAAGEAWERIARLTPEDDGPTATAAALFEKSGHLDLAVRALADGVASVADISARAPLYEKLGELRENAGDRANAGEAFASAAEIRKTAAAWERTEKAFAGASRWDRAAHAATIEAELTPEPVAQAVIYARAGELLTRAGMAEDALARVIKATELDPESDAHASALVAMYRSAKTLKPLAEFLSTRAGKVADAVKRVALRKEAATITEKELEDDEAAEARWKSVLEDGEDHEALSRLVDLAIAREDATEASALLRRLEAITPEPRDKAKLAIREAELLADAVGDVDAAIARYEAVLADLDPSSRGALQAIADLQEARDQPAAAANALERELSLVTVAAERGPIATRLAGIYDQLGDKANTIRAYDIVRASDPEDFDALSRLCELCEQVEDWKRVADLLAQRIEVEGDEDDSSKMTLKLSGILATKLDRGDDALAALTELADQGREEIRAEYVALGDRLGWKGIVASKLVEWWFEAKASPERNEKLRGAFDRFIEVGRDQDAVRVGLELVKSKGADRALGERLEALATKTASLDALAVAHDLLARELTGEPRATELVRQAEARANAGMARTEALQHGEVGLTSIAPAAADVLLDRLARIAEAPEDVVDLYERQVSRAKKPEDRVNALARAAEIASTNGQIDRTEGFLDLALGGAVNEQTLGALEASARAADDRNGNKTMRRALAQAMARGGQGAKDGGRSRAALLRRAASIAQHDLGDVAQAFTWLGEALVAFVEPSTLDAIEALGDEVNDRARAEGLITRALDEVFDGPLVRQLLTRRASMRLAANDQPGAAADLRKLHELTPGDAAIVEQLVALLTKMQDFRGLVQLYEDQVVRGKDMNARADVARKVARMWETELADPREAADAWRRVLRMKAGDPEATAGLDRAKHNMLKRGDEVPMSVAFSQRETALPATRHDPAPPSHVEAPPSSVTSSDLHVAPPPAPPPSEQSISVVMEMSGETGAVDEDSRPAIVPHEVPAKAPRPSNLSFASPPDEVTMSVATAGLIPDSPPTMRTGEDMAAGVPPIEPSTAEIPVAGHTEDSLPTGEDLAFPHSEQLPAATLAHPPAPIDATEEAFAVRNDEDEEEIVIADDFTEVVDDYEEVHPATEQVEVVKPRSTPPPLSRR